MGTLRSEDGGWCCSLLKLPVFFPVTAQCPCPSSIIILHNSLIDFCVTTDDSEGGGGRNRPWTISAQSLQNECAFLAFGLRQGSLIVHKAVFFHWRYPWLECFCNDSDLFCVYANNDKRFLPIFPPYAERKRNPFETAWWSSPPIASVTAQQACCCCPLCGDRSDPPHPGPPPHSPPLLCSVESLRLTMSFARPHSCTRRVARADRFICTQSQRTAASHSNCISAHRGEGWGGGIPWCILLWLRQI